MSGREYAQVGKLTIVGAVFLIYVWGTLSMAVAQSGGEGFGETLQRWAPEIIDQLSCKPYDLDCQNRARMKSYQRMIEDKARMQERSAREEQHEKERSARERCSDREDDRSWALCMKRYLGE